MNHMNFLKNMMGMNNPKYIVMNMLKNNPNPIFNNLVNMMENGDDKGIEQFARKQARMLDSVDFIEDYLDNRYPRECHYSKTIGEFAREYPRGVYLCTMMGHITCIIDGCIYDTFDCSNRAMRCAWKVE